MSMIQGFLRRRGPASDVNMRRHSLFAGDPSSPNDMLDVRVSEQLQRKTSASSLISSPNESTSAMKERLYKPAERPASPPVQDENPKHRRFSMLKFRHASDSQLSTRARQQADAAAAPPIPGREWIDPYPLLG
jgi:hypothetical protein